MNSIERALKRLSMNTDSMQKLGSDASSLLDKGACCPIPEDACCDWDEVFSKLLRDCAGIRVSRSIDVGKLRGDNFEPLAKLIEFDDNNPTRTCGASKSQKRFAVELYACSKDLSGLICKLRNVFKHTSLCCKQGYLENPEVTGSKRYDSRLRVTFYIFNLFYTLNEPDNYGVLL